MRFKRMVPAVLLALELTDTCTAFPAATPWVAFYLLSFVGSPVNGAICSFTLICSDILSSSIWFCMYFVIAVLFRPTATVNSKSCGNFHRFSYAKALKLFPLPKKRIYHSAISRTRRFLFPNKYPPADDIHCKPKENKETVWTTA